jgi:hypothetical protein
MKYKGMLFCGVEARQLIVNKGADTELVRPAKVVSAQINGRFSARIMAEGVVTVARSGWLEGTVYAKSINIEQGGIFQGELFIGQKEVTQADLLPLGDEESKIIELTNGVRWKMDPMRVIGSTEEYSQPRFSICCSASRVGESLFLCRQENFEPILVDRLHVGLVR